MLENALNKPPVIADEVGAVKLEIVTKANSLSVLVPAARWLNDVDKKYWRPHLRPVRAGFRFTCPGVRIWIS